MTKFAPARLSRVSCLCCAPKLRPCYWLVSWASRNEYRGMLKLHNYQHLSSCCSALIKSAFGRSLLPPAIYVFLSSAHFEVAGAHAAVLHSAGLADSEQAGGDAGGHLRQADLG